MSYSGIQLRNFRSYQNHSFELEPGVNIVVGPNASGKTNLLESIYVLSQGRSFRTRDRNLIKHGEGWLRVSGLHLDAGERVLKIKASAKSSNKTEKTIEINKKTKKRLNQNDRVPTLLFEPNHLNLLVGSPKTRRHYLDTLITQIKPGYSTILSKYERALRQRNTLLKDPSTSQDQLFVWGVKLAEYGSYIYRYRTEIISQINQKATDIYSALAKKKTTVSFRYISSIEAKDYSSTLLKKLTTESIDQKMGFTTYGPHREDFVVDINQKPSHNTASRGETRTIVLTAKIIEAELLYEQTNKKPILLLDDVFSELDGARRKALSKHLSDYQVVITTTDAEAILEHFSDNKIIALTLS